MHWKAVWRKYMQVWAEQKMFTAIHWVDHLKEITKVITHIRKSNLTYITCGNYFRDLVDFMTTIYISDYIFFFGI